MNKRFNNKHYWLAIFVVSIIMSGCGMFPPKEKDLIGIWQAEDGAQIIYREDSTCSLIHVKPQVLSEFNKKYHLTFDGWNYDGYWRIWKIPYDFKIQMWNNPYFHGWFCGDSIPCYCTEIKVHHPSLFSSKIDFLYYSIIDIDVDEWYKFYKVQ